MNKFNKLTTTLMATTLVAGSVLAPISQIAVLAEEGNNTTAQKVVDLHKMLEEAKQDAALKEVIYNNAKEAHKDSIKVLEGLEAKLETLRVSEKAKNEELAKATDPVAKAKLETELATIETEITNAEKLIVSTNEEIATITDSIEKTDKEYKNALETAKTIETQLNEILTKIGSTESEISTSNEEIKELQELLGLTKEQKDVKDAKVGTLTEKQSAVTSEVETLKQEIAKEALKLGEETRKRDELVSKLDAKNIELKNAKDELAKIMEETKSIRAEYESKMTDALIALEQKEASESTRDELNAKVESFLSEEFLTAKEAKEQEIIDIQTEMASINQEIINANARLSSAKANVESYKAEMEEKARIAEEARLEVSSKNSELAQVKNDRAAYEALHKAEFEELEAKKQLVIDTTNTLDNVNTTLDAKNERMDYLLAERNSINEEINSYGDAEYQQSQIDALEEEMASGAVGFFKAKGEKGDPEALDAYELLTNAGSGKFGSGVAKYANDTEVGNPDDATSWNNFMFALDMVDETNRLMEVEAQDSRTPFRKSSEVKPYKVSYGMMAGAMFTSNANAKEAQRTGEWDHLRMGIYTGSENIAALPIKGNSDRMMKMLYDGWYKQEKENYILQDRIEKGEDVDLNDPLLQGNPSGQTGHYYNLVKRNSGVTGAAISTYNAKLTYHGNMNAFGTQHITEGEEGYTVDEFRSMANQYRSNLESQLTKWRNAATTVANLKEQLANINAEINSIDEEITSLQLQQNQLASDLAIQTEERDMFENQLAPVFSQLEVLKTNIESLTQQLETLKASLEEKEQVHNLAVQKHDTEVALVNSINKEISEKNANLNEKNDLLGETNKEYDEKYSEEYQNGVKGQLAQAEITLSEKTVNYNQKQALADEALERYTPSKERETEAQKTVNAVNSEKTTLEAELEEANRKVEGTTESIANLNVEKSTKDNELQTIKGELAKTNQEISLLEAKIKEVTTNVAKEEENKLALEGKLSSLNEDLTKKQQETEENKGLANKLVEELDGLKEELTLSGKKLEDTKAKLSGLHSSKNGVVNELRQYSEETINAIKKELVSIKSEIDILTAQIDAQNKEVANKAQEEAKAKADLDKALALIDELTKKIEDAKKEEESKPTPTPTPSQPENNDSNEEVKPNKPTENNTDKVETSKPADKNEVIKGEEVKPNEDNKVTEGNKEEVKPNENIETETPEVEETEEDNFSVVGIVGAGVIVVFGGAGIAYAVKKKNEQE